MDVGVSVVTIALEHSPAIAIGIHPIHSHKDVLVPGTGQHRLVGFSWPKGGRAIEEPRHNAVATAIHRDAKARIITCPPRPLGPHQPPNAVILGYKDGKAQ